MKASIKILFLISSLGLLVGQSGCHKDEATKSEQDVQLGKLAATWKATSATMDGNAQSGYANFVLKMSGAAGSTSFSYSATGRPANNPWPSSGTWTFGSTVASQVIRDKGTAEELPMAYTVTDTELTLDFNFSGMAYAAGRVNSAEGHWVFKFSKQ